jgi:hypothetical protein
MKKQLFILVGIIFLLFAVILFFPIKPVVSLLYSDLGRIEEARISTDWVIKRYEFKGSPREIRNWLTSYHGEADNQQVFYTFIGWSLENQQDFIDIVEEIEPNKKQKVLSLVSSGIIDSVQIVEFENAFRNFDSQALTHIRNEIKQMTER